MGGFEGTEWEANQKVAPVSQEVGLGPGQDASRNTEKELERRQNLVDTIGTTSS